MKLCAGDWVEVRSKDEILATLDKSGRLEGLPFMPQMFKWCGQRFQVYKRAHKTCDTVTGDYVGRQLPNGIHLDLRCDGQAYGGCQAACLIFWKEAWLRPVKQGAPGLTEPNLARAGGSSGCAEADVLKGTQTPDQSSGGNNSLHLPGYRVTRLYPAAKMVGCTAICGGLYFGQHFAAADVSRFALFCFHLRHDGEAVQARASRALAIRPSSVHLGRHSLS